MPLETFDCSMTSFANVQKKLAAYLYLHVLECGRRSSIWQSTFYFTLYTITIVKITISSSSGHRDKVAVDIHHVLSWRGLASARGHALVPIRGHDGVWPLRHLRSSSWAQTHFLTSSSKQFKSFAQDNLIRSWALSLRHYWNAKSKSTTSTCAPQAHAFIGRWGCFRHGSVCRHAAKNRGKANLLVGGSRLPSSPFLHFPMLHLLRFTVSSSHLLVWNTKETFILNIPFLAVFSPASKTLVHSTYCMSVWAYYPRLHPSLN